MAVKVAGDAGEETAGLIREHFSFGRDVRKPGAKPKTVVVMVWATLGIAATATTTTVRQRPPDIKQRRSSSAKPKPGLHVFEGLGVTQAEGCGQTVGKRGKQPEASQLVHSLNKECVEDGQVLDPERPEGLVYMNTRDRG